MTPSTGNNLVAIVKSYSDDSTAHRFDGVGSTYEADRSIYVTSFILSG